MPRPRDVFAMLTAARNDILILDGGMLDQPVPVSLRFNHGLPMGRSKTRTLALQGRCKDRPLGIRFKCPLGEQMIVKAACFSFRLLEHEHSQELILTMRPRLKQAHRRS